MKEHPFRQNKSEISELLRTYYNLKRGKTPSFISEESFEYLIEYFEEREQLEAALEASEIALEQFPFCSGIMIRNADLLLASKKYLQALVVLDKAELYDSTDIDVYILKTDAYLALEQRESAFELFESTINLFEGDELQELLFELADVYDDYEEFDKVFDCLKLILEQEPNNEEALYKICFWTDFTGRNEESIVLHQGIIDDFPYNEIAWFNLAAAYQGIKLYEKAIDAYQFAVTIDEKFDYAYRNMGDAYIKLKKYEEAIDVLEKVLEISPSEEIIHEAIGFCYFKLGSYADSRVYYTNAMNLNPTDGKFHHKISTTYMQEGKWQVAVKHLENALSLKKNVVEYNLAMGECKMNLKSYKEAIQYFLIVVKIKPKNLLGWDKLIRCLFISNQLDEALTFCKKAITSTNNKIIFTFYLSHILFGMGKAKEAIIQLENAMLISPKLIKKFVEINPIILRNSQVVDLIARYKKGKKI